MRTRGSGREIVTEEWMKVVSGSKRVWQDFRFRVTPRKPGGKLITKCPNYH